LGLTTSPDDSSSQIGPEQDSVKVPKGQASCGEPAGLQPGSPARYFRCDDFPYLGYSVRRRSMANGISHLTDIAGRTSPTGLCTLYRRRALGLHQGTAFPLGQEKGENQWLKNRWWTRMNVSVVASVRLIVRRCFASMRTVRRNVTTRTGHLKR
jgi:hypothetical protein